MTDRPKFRSKAQLPTDARVEAYIQHITTTAESGERYDREAWIASREDGLLDSDYQRPW